MEISQMISIKLAMLAKLTGKKDYPARKQLKQEIVELRREQHRQLAQQYECVPAPTILSEIYMNNKLKIYTKPLCLK